MNKELYNEIENYMKACVKETAHDREHIYRVLGNCIKIAENETNVDYDILLAAALTVYRRKHGNTITAHLNFHARISTKQRKEIS